MSINPPRSDYLEQLRHVYGLGVKDADNTIASYDHYFRIMRPGLSLGQLVKQGLEQKPVMRVVDIGCGDAGMLKELLKIHPGRVEAHGIDLVPPKISKQSLMIHVGDALELTFPVDCDLIVSFRSMHEVGALDRLVPKVAQALAIGGKAFLSVRIAESSPEGIEFQGSIAQQDLDYLRDVAGKGSVDTARIACSEVTGQTPGRNAATFVRGVNVFLERV